MALSESAAPELLREQVVALLVRPLEQASVVLRLGPRVFTASGGQPIRVPKIKSYALTAGTSAGFGASAAYWKGENEQIGEVDADFDEVSLLPSSLKSIKTITRFSNELARHAVLDVANAIRSRLVSDVATAVDVALLLGPGTNNTPKGILHFDGRTQVTGSLTVDGLYDLVGVAMQQNVSGSLSWLMNPLDFIAIRKLKASGSGEYLVTPDPTQDNVLRLVGHPVVTTNFLPRGRVVLLDPSAVAVARDLDTTVTMLSERYADYDQIGLRVVTRFDIAPLLPAAVIDATLS